jgi:hypothetical protein
MVDESVLIYNRNDCICHKYKTPDAVHRAFLSGVAYRGTGRWQLRDYSSIAPMAVVLKPPSTYMISPLTPDARSNKGMRRRCRPHRPSRCGTGLLLVSRDICGSS